MSAGHLLIQNIPTKEKQQTSTAFDKSRSPLISWYLDVVGTQWVGFNWIWSLAYTDQSEGFYEMGSKAKWSVGFYRRDLIKRSKHVEFGKSLHKSVPYEHLPDSVIDFSLSPSDVQPLGSLCSILCGSVCFLDYYFIMDRLGKINTTCRHWRKYDVRESMTAPTSRTDSLIYKRKVFKLLAVGTRSVI